MAPPLTARRRSCASKGDLIEEALKKCPPAYSLAARDPQQDLPLDGNHVYLGTDGCGVEVIDIHTAQKRTSCLSDVQEIARVADATEEVAFHWVAVSAQDAPVEARGLHEIKAVWENSTKHVQTESIYNVHEAKAAMEMAAADRRRQGQTARAPGPLADAVHRSPARVTMAAVSMRH